MSILTDNDATITFYDGADDQLIGGIVEYTLDDGDVQDQNITTLASTGQEFQPLLPDPGSLQIQLFRDPSDVGQAAMVAAKAVQAVREVILTRATGEVFTCNAYLKNMSSVGNKTTAYNGLAVLKIAALGAWT